MKPEIVPATAQLLEEFYGHPARQTMRALVAVVGEKPICVAGVYSRNDQSIIFASIKPEMRERYRKTGVRLAHEVMALARANNLMPLYAKADECVEASQRFLQYLGFTSIGGGMYECQD